MNHPSLTSFRSVFRPDLFDGRTMLVTGGGSGIGRCIAHELASLGGSVLILGRNEEKLQRTTQEVAESGGRCCYFVCDIRDEEGVVRTIKRIVADHGPIHGLVNNAGGQFPGALESFSKKGWTAVVDTNLTGTFLMSREVFRQSMCDHGGAIVNIVLDIWSSMPGMAHSGAARGGVVALTQTAAFEWAKSKVRVNAVAPGMVASSGLDTYTDPAAKERIRNMYRHIPAMRPATVAEISAPVVFLLSSAACFITGATLRVDGGSPCVKAGHAVPQHGGFPVFNGFHLDTVPKLLGDREGPQ